MLEELNALINSHFQYIIYRLSLIMHIKGLAVVALTLAHLAGNVNIRQEVHLYLDYTVTLAGFAASALDIERKATACIAMSLSIGSFGKKLADIAEYARICCRI